MNPSRPFLAVFALAVFARAGFAAAVPSAAVPPVLIEARSLATVFRTLDRLGVPFSSVCDQTMHPEDAPFRDFVLDRDIAEFYIGPAADGQSAGISACSPADRDALFALYASEGWSREPDTPEGFQVFVPPSRTYTNYHATVGNKLLSAESPEALRAALDVLPTLPAILPAEGDGYPVAHLDRAFFYAHETYYALEIVVIRVENKCF